MSSAGQLEVEEPGNGLGPDLYLLLREIHPSKLSNLNLLHPRGKILIAEGEPARGVHILRSGKATVSISSTEGQVVILRTAQAGDVLGLNSALRNSVYETTVRTLGTCCTDFISRHELMELMDRSQPALATIQRLLSQELSDLTERARLLLLSQTVGARLAKLLLEWAKHAPVNNSYEGRIDKAFTHEEMAQMLCSSRETVTRLLTILSRRQIIRICSNSIVIRDYAALEAISMG